MMLQRIIVGGGRTIFIGAHYSYLVEENVGLE